MQCVTQCILALCECLLDGAVVRVGRVVRRSRKAILVEVDRLQLRQPTLVDGFRQSVDADGADLVELEAELLELRQRTLGGGRRERHDAGVADAVAVDKEPLQLGEDAAAAAARRREVREVSKAVVVQPVVGEGELAHLPVAHCGQRLVQLCHVLRLEQPAPQVDLLAMLGASAPHLQYVSVLERHTASRTPAGHVYEQCIRSAHAVRHTISWPYDSAMRSSRPAITGRSSARVSSPWLGMAESSHVSVGAPYWWISPSLVTA